MYGVSTEGGKDGVGLWNETKQKPTKKKENKLKKKRLFPSSVITDQNLKLLNSMFNGMFFLTLFKALMHIFLNVFVFQSSHYLSSMCLYFSPHINFPILLLCVTFLCLSRHPSEQTDPNQSWHDEHSGWCCGHWVSYCWPVSRIAVL